MARPYTRSGILQLLSPPGRGGKIHCELLSALDLQ